MPDSPARPTRAGLSVCTGRACPAALGLYDAGAALQGASDGRSDLPARRQRRAQARDRVQVGTLIAGPDGLRLVDARELDVADLRLRAQRRDPGREMSRAVAEIRSERDVGDLLARAVPRHDERTLREVQRRQAVLEQAEAPLDWIAGDRAFHEALYVPASRARSLQIYFQLRAPIDRLSVQRLSPAARKEPWAIEHRSLIAAIRAADARAAVAALTDHLNETRALVLAARRSMGDS